MQRILWYRTKATLDATTQINIVVFSGVNMLQVL